MLNSDPAWPTMRVSALQYLSSACSVVGFFNAGVASIEFPSCTFNGMILSLLACITSLRLLSPFTSIASSVESSSTDV